MHQPVLLNETVSNLITDIHGVYVDCTLGGGGHFRNLLKNIAEDAHVIGIDKDVNILEMTRKSINYPNVSFVQSDFRNLRTVLENLNIFEVDGVMMDLGVSSFQLDTAERGFSFHEDADLDMRMNRQQEITAKDIVNNYTEQELNTIFFNYGEEKYARRISRAISNYRKKKNIESTLELVEIIKAAVPQSYKREKHPARKSFQALRIEVNKELDALTDVLPQAVKALKPGGRLCVISFHSLEDRIVKKFMQEKARDCICPPGLPICVCDHKAELKKITRKPIIASELECQQNSRARSAKLRVAERI